MFIISYAAKAREDIREIAIWYHEQNPGLENDFLVNLESSINGIEDNPRKFQIHFRQTRSVLLRRFPYRVIYKVTKNTILIVGVFHTSRNPKIISKRSKDEN